MTNEPTNQVEILLVDDDPTTCLLLSTLLKSKGYRASSAIDGFEAKECVERKTPDAIVLDVMMPRMDGIRFLQWLQETHDVHIPVIAITGIDKESVHADVLLAGADAVLAKPLDADELLHALTDVLSCEKE